MKTSVWKAATLAVVLAAGFSTTAFADVAKNKEAVRVFYEEAIIKKNVNALDGVLAKGVTVEFAPSYVSSISKNNKLSGIDQTKQHIANATKAMTFSGPIVDMIAEGNKVALYRVVTEKMPDGRTAICPWVSIFEFDATGKISKIKHVHDTLIEKNAFATPKK